MLIAFTIVFIVMLMLFVLISISTHLRERICFGVLSHTSTFAKPYDLAIRGSVLAVELANFFYFNCKLARYPVRLKYNIKCELVTASIAWIS